MLLQFEVSGSGVVCFATIQLVFTCMASVALAGSLKVAVVLSNCYRLLTVGGSPLVHRACRYKGDWFWLF